MNAINYWHLMTIIKEADEEPEAPTPDDSGGEMDMGGDSPEGGGDSKPAENLSLIHISEPTRPY